jgi:hypothetical protein
MVFDDHTICAATNLAARLQGKPWFSSVGMAEEGNNPVLIIYLTRKPKVIEIPPFWEGIPIRIQEIGKVRTSSYSA